MKSALVPAAAAVVSGTRAVATAGGAAPAVRAAAAATAVRATATAAAAVVATAPVIAVPVSSSTETATAIAATAIAATAATTAATTAAFSLTPFCLDVASVATVFPESKDSAEAAALVLDAELLTRNLRILKRCGKALQKILDGSKKPKVEEQPAVHGPDSSSQCL